MACADVDMEIHDYENPDGINHGDPPIIQQHQASEMVPNNKELLHYLVQKYSADLGYLQMISGLFSIGVGIVLSRTYDIGRSLSTLFRVPQLTGALFFLAGLGNLLFIYPVLLTASLIFNCGCIIVAVVAVCLISVDLAHWNLENSDLLKLIEVVELCLLGFEIVLSAIICFWFSKETRAKSK